MVFLKMVFLHVYPLPSVFPVIAAVLSSCLVDNDLLASVRWFVVFWVVPLGVAGRVSLVDDDVALHDF